MAKGRRSGKKGGVKRRIKTEPSASTTSVSNRGRRSLHLRIMETIKEGLLWLANGNRLRSSCERNGCTRMHASDEPCFQRTIPNQLRFKVKKGALKQQDIKKPKSKLHDKVKRVGKATKTSSQGKAMYFLDRLDQAEKSLSSRKAKMAKLNNKKITKRGRPVGSKRGRPVGSKGGKTVGSKRGRPVGSKRGKTVGSKKEREEYNVILKNGRKFYDNPNDVSGRTRAYYARLGPKNSDRAGQAGPKTRGRRAQVVMDDASTHHRGRNMNVDQLCFPDADLQQAGPSDSECVEAFFR